MGLSSPLWVRHWIFPGEVLPSPGLEPGGFEFWAAPREGVRGLARHRAVIERGRWLGVQRDGSSGHSLGNSRKHFAWTTSVGAGERRGPAVAAGSSGRIGTGRSGSG